MIDQLLTAVLLGIPASYLLRVMLLQENDSHEGPFKSKTRTVYFSETKHSQQVALWDWIRRLVRVYDVEGNIWTVNRESAERFTCPFCLSFWTSWVISLPAWMLLSGLPDGLAWLFWLVIFHFAIAVASLAVYRYILD